MNRQYARKHTARRALAVLLSLLMLLQSVSAFAEDIGVPETNPAGTIEAAEQVPETPAETAAVPAETAENTGTSASESTGGKQCRTGRNCRCTGNNE